MDEVTLPPDQVRLGSRPTADGPVPALVVLWAAFEPARVGEAILLPPHPPQSGWLLGRRASPAPEDWPRPTPFRQRPGLNVSTGPLLSPTLSRRQLLLQTADSGHLHVENVGRCPLIHQGQEVRSALAKPGDLLELAGQLLFLCTERPAVLPGTLSGIPYPLPPFGEPDPFGLVGESPPMWALRLRLVELARLDGHILILGASGTGKELVAQALHALSPRGHLPMISRNAATFPESLIDAELFGNIRHFPNVGMPERPGLVGQADGSSLFLDEIGDLPLALQCRLLRVMDGGEFQRLGEATPRRANLRILAATSGSQASLRPDLLARFRLSLTLPRLEERREDIPLLSRTLARGLVHQYPWLTARAGEPDDALLQRLLSGSMVRELASRDYVGHVRELEALVIEALRSPDESRWASLAPYPRPSERAHQPVKGDSPVGVRVGGQGLEASITPFADAEMRRLEVFREVGFRVSAYAAHPLIQRDRTTAHVHLQVLLFEALGAANLNIEQATDWIIGAEQKHRGAVRRRLEALRESLRQQLEDEGETRVAARLKRRFRSASMSATRLITLLMRTEC